MEYGFKECTEKGHFGLDGYHTLNFSHCSTTYAEINPQSYLFSAQRRYFLLWGREKSFHTLRQRKTNERTGRNDRERNVLHAFPHWNKQVRDMNTKQAQVETQPVNSAQSHPTLSPWPDYQLKKSRSGRCHPLKRHQWFNTLLESVNDSRIWCTLWQWYWTCVKIFK